MFSFLLVGPRLRRITEKMGSLSIPDYIGDRYKSNTARCISAIIILVFVTMYIAAVLMGTSRALQGLAGVPYVWGVILGAVICAIYIVMGGYIAVVWTDFIQGIVMAVALVLAFFALLIHLGGYGPFLSSLEAIDPKLVSLPGAGLPVGTVFGVAMVWSIAATGQPQMLIRFYSIKKTSDFGKALAVAAISWAVWGFCSMQIGVMGRVLFPTEYLATSGLIAPVVVKTFLPGFLAAFFIGGVIAASMSTADSLALQASSSIARDVYQRLLKPDAKDKSVLKISRLLVPIILIAAVLMVIKPPMLILLLAALAAGTLGAAIMPSVLCGLWWKRGTKEGSIVSMVFAVATAAIWHKMGNPYIHNFIPALIVALIAFVVVSYLTPQPTEEFLDEVMEQSGEPESQLTESKSASS